MSDDDTGFFRNLGGLANDWVSNKRKRLAHATPDTRVDSGGSVNKYSFDGQEIDRGELLDIKDMRESGGVISQLLHAKALMNFGTGVEFHVDEADTTEMMIDGVEMTQVEFLKSIFNDVETAILDIGEDALWYPFGAAEIVETRGGDFSHIEPIEPWTLQPQTDEHGDIVMWEQHTQSDQGRVKETFQPDEIVHFVVNKSSARDKTGLSAVLRSREEIQTFRENQQAIRSAIELHGFPQRHVQAGREGATPLDNTELRRIRSLFDARTTDSDTVYVTGPDVEINTLESESFDFEKITSNDLQMLALALGVPIEAVDFGSEGLGSGEQSKVRRAIMELDILATQRTYMNQWITEVIRPVLRDYSPFDHTVNIEMRLEDPITGQDEMADLINQVGDFMETNEARAKLDLPEKEDLEGEYGAPGDDGSDDPLGGMFSDAIDQELQDRGLGDTDFSDFEVTEGELAHAPEFDQPFIELHQKLWGVDGGRELLQFRETATPEFVKEHIRTAIHSGAIFSSFENVPSNELTQLREYMTETLESDGWTIDGLADQLEQLPGVDPDNAEVIARTETASVLNTAREDAYESEGQLDDSLFYWSGNLDHRVTDACKWLIQQTNPNHGGEPVPLDELKDLIEEAPTHDSDMDDNLARPDDYVVHPQERKTFVRAPAV